MERNKSRTSRCIALEVSKILYECLGTSSALASSILLREDIQGLVEHTVDPRRYSDWRVFYADWCSVNLLAKWQHFDIGVDRAQVAIDKFLASEQRCKETNNRLSKFNRTVFGTTDRLPQVISTARAKIERLLSQFSWDEALLHMGFGPGAAIGIPRRKGDSWHKFGSLEPTMTSNCASLSQCLFKHLDLWQHSISGIPGGDPTDRFKIVRGNRVTTVPKNARTDRVIAVEPLMNMFFQKGIGGIIRERLKIVGVNLDDQTRNQDLSKLGSITGELATIDLSSASDTVALGLVDLLLPDDWVTAMKLVRSWYGTLPSGECIFYQKVSSMGNGFTFELESLLFWAICSSVIELDGWTGRDLAVYGDDIIVPRSTAAEVIRILDYCGFTVNREKSFVDGPFRESCGKHYFLGHDVTPIYIKDNVDDPDRYVWLANSILMLASRHAGLGWGKSVQFRKAYDYVVRQLPRKLQKRGVPYTLGHVALWKDFDEVLPKRHSGYQNGWVCHGTVRLYKTFKGHGMAQLLKSLWALGYSAGSVALREFVPLRGRKPEKSLAMSLSGVSLPDRDLSEIPLQRYKSKDVKLWTQQWADLGPWF